MSKKCYFTSAIVKMVFLNLLFSLMTASISVYLIVFLEATFAFHSRAMFSFLTPAFLYSYVYFIVGLCYLIIPFYIIFHVLDVVEKKYLSDSEKLHSFESRLGSLSKKLRKLLFRKFIKYPSNEKIEKSTINANAKPLGKWLMKLIIFKYKRIHHLGSFAVIIGFFWMDSQLSFSLPDNFTPTLIISTLLFFFFGGKKNTLYVFITMIVVILISFFTHYQYFSAGNNFDNILQGKGKPNVLLLVSDTTRQDHMTFYGYNRNTTPHLDIVAQKSVLYKNAYTTSAWTKPATASLVTGMSLVSDTIHNGAYPISYRGLHMAELFRENGYDTALISANSNASSYYGHAKGYNYRTHSLPPQHIAYHKFTSVRFFTEKFNGKASLKLKSNDNTLEEYCNYLKIEVDQVNDFIHGKMNPGVKISASEIKKYKFFLKTLLSKKIRDELSTYPKLLPVQNVWYYSLIKSWYQKILYFYYFKLENAEGEIVIDWLTDSQLVKKFVKWNGSRVKHKSVRKPFFAHIQFMGPHTPYTTQVPYLLPYFDAEYKKSVISPPTQHTPPSVPAPKMPARKLENLIANYDNSIRTTDANMGNLLDYLETIGELNNTIVVFVADHGEAFYEHYIYGHMNSLHNELIDIPLFFFWKNKLKPARLTRQASIIDIFPSLSVLAGVPIPRKLSLQLEGESLFKENRQPLTDERSDFQLPIFTIVGSAWKMNRKSGVPFGLHSGVITKQGKLIKENEETGTRYLYFRNTDRYEKREFYDIEHKNLPKEVKNHLRLLLEEPEIWKLIH